MEHEVIPLGEIHKPHNWEFANAAARGALVGATSTNIGALALQVDDGSYWRLESIAPLTWTPFVTWAGVGGKPAFGSAAPLNVPASGDAAAGEVVKGNDSRLADARPLAAGAEKTKLASIAAGATVNATDAALRDRTTHTGAQAISTVTGLQTALDAKAAASSLGTSAALNVAASGNAAAGEVVKGNDSRLSDSRQLAAGADKTKLDGIATGATANDTDANLRARSSHTGTQAISTVSGLQTALDAKPDMTLVGGLIPSSFLPSYVDDVLEYANLAAFPGTGETGKMYVALDSNKIYRWSGSVYVEISGSPGSTDAVPEGSINLYFTVARVRTVALAGLSLLTNAAITASDTVLDAFGKLQKQITDLAASLGTAAVLNVASSGDASTGQVVKGNDTRLTDARPLAAGADKTKLDGIASGATANSADATLLARGNHTGSQAISTVTDLQTTLDAKIATTAKDSSGGVPGLTGFALNMRNTANTFTSTLENGNTAARAYVLPDRSGTIADNADLALKAPVASPAFTGNAFVNGATGADTYVVINQNDLSTTNTNRPALSFRKNNSSRLQISSDGAAAGAGTNYYESLGSGLHAHVFITNAAEVARFTAAGLTATGALSATGTLVAGAGSGSIVLTGGSTCTLNHNKTAAGGSFDINDMPFSSSEQSLFRFHRSVTTSGLVSVQYFLGDGSTTQVHSFISGGTGGVTGSRFALCSSGGTGLVGTTTYDSNFRIRVDSLGMRSDGPITSSGKIGYGPAAAGAGGAVTQGAAKTSGVTLNTLAGAITSSAASLAAGATAVFTLTNSNIAADDVLIVHRKSGGTAGAYRVFCDSVSAGSCTIVIENRTAGALAEALILSFAILRGAIT